MTAGHLDTTFGLFGMTAASVGGERAEANALAIQPDGKIVTVGVSYHGGAYALAAARFLPNGRLDPAFGGGAGLMPGEVRIPLARGYSTAYAVALQPDGKIVIGGGVSISATTGYTNMCIVRLMPDGTLDHGFAIGGCIVIETYPSSMVYGLTVLHSGKIIATGSSLADGTLAFTLAGLRSDGSLDPSFGSGGLVRTVIGLRSTILAPVSYAIVDQGFGIVVCGRGIIGSAGAGPLLPCLARYKTDGSLDPGFGDHGTLAIPFGAQGQCDAIAVSANYYILAAGNTSTVPPFNFLLTVLDPHTGRPAFTHGPVVTTSFADLGYPEAHGTGCVVHNDGQGERWLVAGVVVDGAKRNIGLARYHWNGALDPSFAGGRVVTSFLTGPCDASGVAVQPADHKIVVVCTANYGATKIFGLARYLGV